MYTSTTQSTDGRRHRQEGNTFWTDAPLYIVIAGSLLLMYHMLTNRELTEASSHEHTRSTESTLIKQASL